MSLLDVFGWETFGLLRERSFLVFMALTVIICFPMSAYNAYVPVYLKDNGVSNVGGLMTLGQVTEFILMFCLGYLIRRIGMRWIFALACFAWFLIAGTFAVANDVSLPLIVFAILVRGAGWDFFYASSEVYINGKATAELKTRGQSLLRTATYGLGTIVGSLGSGAIYNAMTSGGTAQAGLHWSTFWGIVAIVPLVLFFLVLCAFRDDGRQPSTRPEVLGTV
jgi:MFS family permease